MIKFAPHFFYNPVSKKNFDPPPRLSTPPPKEKFRPPPSFWTIRTLIATSFLPILANGHACNILHACFHVWKKTKIQHNALAIFVRDMFVLDMFVLVMLVLAILFPVMLILVMTVVARFVLVMFVLVISDMIMIVSVQWRSNLLCKLQNAHEPPAFTGPLGNLLLLSECNKINVTKLSLHGEPMESGASSTCIV